MQRQVTESNRSDDLVRMRPRPLALAIVELPYLYLRGLFAPIARWFAEEGARASWAIVWVQILLVILVPSILGYLRGLDRSASARDATNSQALGDVLTALTVSTTAIGILVQILIVPLLFFFSAIVEFALARAFRGNASFLSQCYTMLLYHVPLSIIGSAVSTIFIAIHIPLGVRLLLYPLITIGLFVYGFFVNISVVTGIHHVSRGRATTIVSLAYAIFAVIAIVLIVILTHVIVNALHTT